MRADRVLVSAVDTRRYIALAMYYFYMARAFFARFIALTALAIEYQQNVRAHSIKQIYYSFASFKYLWCVFCLYIFNGGVVFFFLGQFGNDHILFLDVLIIMPRLCPYADYFRGYIVSA